MGNLLEFAEAQKAAGTLDGVDGAKNSRQRILVLRIFLQPHQVPVQPVQVLVTLDQKFLNDIAFAHRQSPSNRTLASRKQTGTAPRQFFLAPAFSAKRSRFPSLRVPIGS